MLIGITGVARSGKDTLYSMLKTINPKITRFALADELKLDCDKFLREKVGISAFTTTKEEKDLIRPFFVEYGDMKRKQSKGTYWTSLLQKKIDDCIAAGDIPCVTDVRYDEYRDSDELSWLSKNNGILIHVTRTEKDGSKVLPPNARERDNDPRMCAASNFRLNWPTSDDSGYLFDVLNKQLGELVDRIKKYE